MTGINEARDASNPDERAAVGVQKLQAANSNVATRHILDTSLYITERAAEAASLRLADAIEFWPKSDRLINAIGRSNTKILDSIKDFNLHDFGIFIEVGPDEEEKAFLEANIQQALAKDQIYLEDAMEIRDIKNPSLAGEVLKVRRKKKMQMDHADESTGAGQLIDRITTCNQPKQHLKQKQRSTKRNMQRRQKLEQMQQQNLMQRLAFEKESQKELMSYEHDLATQMMGMKSVEDEFTRNHQGEVNMKEKKFESVYDSKLNESLDDKII